MNYTKKSDNIYRNYTEGKSNEELIGYIGFGNSVHVDKTIQRKVLITGKGSYIGESFLNYVSLNYEKNFTIDTLDMQNSTWKNYDFSKYDIVYHVAGIAHTDIGNVSEVIIEKYYSVNTNLAIEVARKAKKDGVREFIFMSSMIVYGEAASYGKKKIIDRCTVPQPVNFYGDSKLQADVGIRELADERFKVIVLRPPMIYGRDSRGNYPILVKLAKKMPIFPNIDNERSMLYIDNLCEFLCQIMLINSFKENAIVLFPQNKEFVSTCQMVKEIVKVTEKKILITKILNPFVFIGSKIPGKFGMLMNKAFGNNCYQQEMSVYDGVDYQKISLKTSIKMIERKGIETV